MSSQPAGYKPREVFSIKCNITDKVFKGGAGGKHKGQAVKKTVIQKYIDAAGTGGGTDKNLELGRSKQMNGILVDQVVPANMMPKNKSLAKINIDNKKIKGVQWVNNQPKVNVEPAPEGPVSLPMVNFDNVEAAKEQIAKELIPRKVQNMFKSLEAVPIKDFNGEDQVKKPTPINLNLYKDEQRQLTLGGRMQDAMDYTDVYLGRGDRKAKAYEVTVTPRAKEPILGSSPTKMTFNRIGSDFNQFKTLDVEGATPMKKTHNMGSEIESLPAGQKPVAGRGKLPVKQPESAKNSTQSSFIFSDGGSFGGSLKEKKIGGGSGSQRHANSNGIKAIFGGSQYGDFQPKIRSGKKVATGAGKTYASSGVASVFSHDD